MGSEQLAVARALAPARRRSRRKTSRRGLPARPRQAIWGSFAAQREQAPSSRGVVNRLAWVDVLQCPVCEQFAQFDQLLDAQGHVTR
jgi:hypothetical protein